MCVILIAMQQSERFPFILAANRDEFYQRPSAQAEFWRDHPDVLAGRDLEAQGTWLGINRSGKIAAVTNHYSPQSTKEASRSRGELVSEFLISTETTDQYSENLRTIRDQFNGYGLLIGDSSRLRYQSNESEFETDLTTGVHALSNTLLSSPGARAQTGMRLLEDMLKNQKNLTPEALFEILFDEDAAASLEPAGNEQAKESMHQVNVPIFVRMEGYGTCCSTVLLIDRFQNVFFEERTFYENAERYRSRRSFEFKIAE